MSDDYAQFAHSPIGKLLVKQLGLPNPVSLRRWKSDAPLCDSPVLVAGVSPAGQAYAEGGYATAVTAMLAAHGITVEAPGEAGEDAPRLGGLVLDLAALRDPGSLEAFRAIAAPAVKRLARNARVVLIGTDPDLLVDPVEVATQRALDGITRSIAKELRAGATANLVFAPSPLGVDEPNLPAVAHTVEFLLSGHSAFVDGQPIRIDENPPLPNPSAEKPLQGKVAVVTGAARGIGAAIVEVLARDGATVVGVDVPAAGDVLAKVVNAAKGSALTVDVTAPDAGQKILEHCRSRHGGLDIVVHNAGITRDKLFVNTDADRWGAVIAVNLQSILTMSQTLLGPDGLGEGGRVICLSSQSGFAGNRGQTNYAATKAAIIGLVDALADEVAERGITVNAVAPGLIETEMTAKMPFATREVARRINSLQQGGLPVDVAEVISFLAQPASQSITGQTIRVCGQHMVGA
ncbi:3-oxoacyl-ACP reductase [Enemella dayhoffiae]|uniref:3-oxoacyl-ACP reductase n=1 Tax=Enemella dayhoffiae TaxID=2016507 RepID=A0A255HA64_9ACTN|nr:3-oxoacyl-ACP reductase [Enemella dayhoffiae]OYO24700.1 3-oxoacyl-ACP reductase [Enemella dayhoffiae]